MSKKLVLTVGNSMMGDDGAGPLLAEMMLQNPVDDWVVIDGGSAPENYVHQIRELAPEQVLIVDAAEIGEKAGEIRIIEPDQIAEMFIMSTHCLPLNFLIEELETFVPQVTFIGIQPAIVAFSFPMTDMVRDAVTALYQALPTWQGQGEFATV
ncbi:hydrogenase 3 maturation endopeptidase HyCI [Photobacterium jeanii]|uniref:Hydrogenase 3 maturation endopeptidase HyCI n=1 Tax=Photobacterium jeanii TaxID=858640 RepID=A0A178K2Y9_9GAMM|nr:hydrogenase maturation peptidase HycI [Photobacterium jeanii]OAN11315.1 hydrogenase 3 maturation endopeptidase HyCI [Photobacterium jeanii]PST90837.1 hydrogenase maturation peptidase HycI [Photobacterium jeanii]